MTSSNEILERLAATIESRLAADFLDGKAHPDVLVTGHPFVDIWQAVKPSVAGIQAWPEVPRGQAWKEGVLDASGRIVEDRRQRLVSAGRGLPKPEDLVGMCLFLLSDQASWITGQIFNVDGGQIFRS